MQVFVHIKFRCKGWRQTMLDKETLGIDGMHVVADHG